ncbi:DnaJ domain-containing protein [Polychytrium aggregatum]|uniref:DnaJ domain-containing protein n=1 Tax=Polychytrium aggregatum TaxID=110093 RepID=UPI0022FE54FA|nr:DnaJ domain-containing protein [Polychytrium aggregatum]KAI9208713.1 DnaJ domain-containing protein [Polychytrium aggregatum]
MFKSRLLARTTVSGPCRLPRAVRSKGEMSGRASSESGQSSRQPDRRCFSSRVPPSRWKFSETPYQVLGVDKHAKLPEIKKKYYQLSMTFHPDRSAQKSEAAKKQAHDQFIKIQQAYDLLSDRLNRSDYDLYGGSPTGTSSSTTWTPPPYDPFQANPGQSWEQWDVNAGPGSQYNQDSGLLRMFSPLITVGALLLVSGYIVKWYIDHMSETRRRMAWARFHHVKSKEGLQDVVSREPPPN